MVSRNRQGTWMVALPALIVGLVVGLGVGLAADGPQRSRYVNRGFGFSLDLPAWPAPDQELGNRSIAQWMAPPVGGFADNISVVIQPQDSADHYIATTTASIEAMGLTLHETRQLTVSGQPAARLEYSGVMMGRDLHFMALAVFQPDYVILITCGAPPERIDSLKAEFEASLSSFTLLEQ